MFQDEAGFEFEEYQPPDGNWGAPLDPNDLTGEWNGLVREVIDGRADFAHAALSTTPQRSIVVNYGMFFFEDR